MIEQAAAAAVEGLPWGPLLGAGIGLVAALLGQTAALFYWGGQIKQTTREHARRLNNHGRRIEDLEEKLGHHERRD